ncbi:MAG: ribbon-helix-helix protein, CopG family [Pseudanabaena sp. CAN_BIN31]|nr:ribbon-helix-helix protein, CopG family [Pseudanabaena sp. CAN_BIN31]
MAIKKHPIPAYLDEVEFEMLTKIASAWGLSLSGTIKRLIRDKKE